MKCQIKCDKEATTIYNSLIVCSEHWAKLSYKDDKKQAELESIIGDNSEDTRSYQ